MPAGQIPQFFRNVGGHRGAPASVDEWRPLRPPPHRYAPLPLRSGHLPDAGQSATPEWVGTPEAVHKASYGPGRLGQELGTWAYTSGIDGEGRPHGEWDVSAVLPERWRPDQMAEAFRAALMIVRHVNLDLGASAHRVFMDAKGQWWALPERRAGAGGGGFWARGHDRPAPVGLPRWDGSWLQGQLQPGEPEAWFLYSRDPEPESYPISFFDSLGGVSGPLEWAFEVISRLNRLRDQEHWWRERRRDLRALAGLAEWQALSRAALASDNPDLLNAIHNLENGVIRGGDGLALRNVFARGFELGDALAFSTAANLVRKSEDDRNRGKVDLRAALLAIATEEAAKGPLKPHTLAGALIEERNAGTERGLKLGRLGLPADANRIGVLIKEEAKAAGLL